MTVDELKTQVLSLSERDRAEFARLLIASLDDENEDDINAAWVTELERRSNEIKSGAVKGIPAADVYAELKREFP